MSDPAPAAVQFTRSFEVHGVRVTLGASDPAILARLVSLLPPETEPCPPDPEQRHFALARGEGGWWYDNGTGKTSVMPDLELAIGMLDSQLRFHIARSSPEKVFVHAGAVAHQGRAILLPGETFSGKSTLVAALVRAGAEYFSDEYAILDEEGLVHPYARPISIRGEVSWSSTDHRVESLGGVAGVDPVPVGLVATTRYRPDARWDPQRRSPGEGVLAILAHTVTVRDRPAQALAAVRRALGTAVILESDRGEADETARVLMEIASELPDGAGTDVAGPR